MNKYRADGAIEWPIVEGGSALSKVLNVTDNGFDLIQDQLNKADDCYFWRDTFAALTNFGGKFSLDFGVGWRINDSGRIRTTGSSCAVEFVCK